jgi:ABC-type antimicrobial peptide transport system permease subunit
VGILGLTTRMVAARRRELGIRTALGAQRRQITRSVMTTEATALGLGIVAGLLLSAIAVRGLETFLFGISPWHPATFVQAAVVLAGLGILASYLPARRAAEANPMEVLRTD